MKLVRLLWPVSLLLALWFALGGQVRAVDVADPDDSQQISRTDDDNFTAPSVDQTIEPPTEGKTVPPTPLTMGAGRMALSDLFRPPQATRA